MLINYVRRNFPSFCFHKKKLMGPLRKYYTGLDEIHYTICTTLADDSPGFSFSGLSKTIPNKIRKKSQRQAAKL